MSDSTRGYCPRCDRDDVILTPGRMNPDALICFTCGGDVNRLDRQVPASAYVAESSGYAQMVGLADLEYDKPVLRDAPTDEDERVVASRQVSKRIRRRQRAAELARLSESGRVVFSS